MSLRPKPSCDSGVAGRRCSDPHLHQVARWAVPGSTSSRLRHWYAPPKKIWDNSWVGHYGTGTEDSKNTEHTEHKEHIEHKTLQVTKADQF